MRGKFITLEGPDGSGKTTISKIVFDQLMAEGYKVLLTREPGGIDIAEQIRAIILDKKNIAMEARTEALLYAAARRQHLIEKIEPALNDGYLVICDRFIDSSLVYQGVARNIGIDEVYSELLPSDKVNKLEEVLNKKVGNGKVLFVGDGINDAPVLARADIGIAMGGVGSDAAIEAADVVLMKDKIESISDAIRISRKTNKILWQNIIFSLFIKVVVMILVVAGLTNMWAAVFADVGVTLLAVLNSMRIIR